MAAATLEFTQLVQLGGIGLSLAYIVRRLLATIPVLIGVTLLVFLMLHLIPGDPVYQILGEHASDEAVLAMRKSIGLDRPIHEQYLDFVSKAVRGDLGRSVITGREMSKEIANRFPLTLRIAVMAIGFEILIGFSLGMVAALNHRKITDNLAMTGALLGVSTPSFWLALLLMLVFGAWLKVVPLSGYSGWSSLILPALTLGLLSGGRIARMTRSSMLEVLRQDYIRTARSKGLAERVVIYKHALKNALIPVITLIGMDFGSLLGGAIITETVFAIPGVAQLAINGINNRDFPMVQAVVLVMAVVFTMTNLAVDLIYSAVDPRIKLQ